jgi:hypothetical protein
LLVERYGDVDSIIEAFSNGGIDRVVSYHSYFMGVRPTKALVNFVRVIDSIEFDDLCYEGVNLPWSVELDRLLMLKPLDNDLSSLRCFLVLLVTYYISIEHLNN